MAEDIRSQAVDGRRVWRDGRCTACGALTYGSDAVEAPPEALTPFEDRRLCDYYVWCANLRCPYFVGECVGDMCCPPHWATHDRT
jgi:hypothetical protein